MRLGELVLGVCSGAAILVIVVAAVRVGIAALGTPGDRAAVNRTLRHAAGLLGGRYRDRSEYPWYRRPAQYGVVEGALGGVGYELHVLPWNTEDHGGAAMLRIRPGRGRPAGGRPELVVFSAGGWHWPDLADPETLADFVRRAISIAESGQLPPEA